jgi:hypothetical protein
MGIAAYCSVTSAGRLGIGVCQPDIVIIGLCETVAGRGLYAVNRPWTRGRDTAAVTAS